MKRIKKSIKKEQAEKQKIRRIEDKIPNQSRVPGEIQGFSKHLKPNKGQGRGQRVKAHETPMEKFERKY